MFTVKHMALPYGISITASHNPAIYNGIKVFMEGGRDADEVLTEELEELTSIINPDDITSIPFDEAVESGAIKMIDP